MEARVIARGVGQVMFQNNALSGLLMLAGIFFSSWSLGMMALGGNIVSTFVARVSGCREADIQDGLYGFNGTLVGLGVGVFMQTSPISLLLMAAVSCLTVLLVRLFSMQHAVPGFTAPFILSVWLLLAICSWLMPHSLLPSGDAVSAACGIQFMHAFSLGLGQVMFQADEVVSLCFLVALWVNSRVDAGYAVWGAALSLPLAMLLGVDAGTLNNGLMGYNGVLCALAFSGKSGCNFLWASVSVALSVLLQLAGQHWEIPTLTAPFVLAVWITLLLQKVPFVSKEEV